MHNRECKLVIAAVLLLVLAACGGRGRGNSDITGDGAQTDAVDTWPTDLGELPDGAECFDGMSRCNANADGTEVCQGGAWQSGETCAMACEGGACTTEALEGTCGSPVAIGFDENLLGNTGESPASSQTWAAACTTSYRYDTVGPEMVYALEVTEMTAATVTLDALDATYYGLYVRSSCNDTLTQLRRGCDASPAAGEGATLPVLLSPGTWYVFVDDFADPAGTGAYTVSVDRTGVPMCHGQVPVVLDITSGSATVQGDTAAGLNGTNWHEYACPISLDTVGKEIIHAFTLRASASVRVSARPTAPATSKLGLYLRSDCENAQGNGQLVCSYTDGTGADATFTEALTAGTYYVFVDDLAASQDGPQAFELTVEILE